MKSWGHSIEALPLVEANLRFATGEACSAPRCEQPPVARAGYYYVSGKAGRTAHAIRLYCPEHAARFGAAHGLGVPPSPVIDPVAVSIWRVLRAWKLYSAPEWYELDGDAIRCCFARGAEPHRRDCPLRLAGSEDWRTRTWAVQAVPL